MRSNLISSHCIALLMIAWQCARNVAFETLEDKKEFAKLCQTSWPCESVKGASLAADSIRTRAPFVELPREIVMDVNKPPFPIVNVIAEEPAASSTSVQSFRAQLAHKNSARAEGRAAVREGQRMLLEKLAILAARARGSDMKDVERVASDAQQAGTAFLKASAKLPSNKEVRAKIMAENAALLGTIGEQLAAEAATQEPSSCPECIHG